MVTHSGRLRKDSYFPQRPVKDLMDLKDPPDFASCVSFLTAYATQATVRSNPFATLNRVGSMTATTGDSTSDPRCSLLPSSSIFMACPSGWFVKDRVRLLLRCFQLDLTRMPWSEPVLTNLEANRVSLLVQNHTKSILLLTTALADENVVCVCQE